ncbi:MAG: helix-turn-helix domain-containing protein [Dehalococcoidia bacterium]|jgi:excisionase family DNA binding protein
MVAAVEAKPVFTVEETAHLLGLSVRSAYEGVYRGDIPSLRIGRRILIPRARLEALLNGSTPQAEGA